MHQTSQATGEGGWACRPWSARVTRAVSAHGGEGGRLAYKRGALIKSMDASRPHRPFSSARRRRAVYGTARGAHPQGRRAAADPCIMHSMMLAPRRRASSHGRAPSALPFAAAQHAARARRLLRLARCSRAPPLSGKKAPLGQAPACSHARGQLVLAVSPPCVIPVGAPPCPGPTMCTRGARSDRWLADPRTAGRAGEETVLDCEA